MTSPIERKCTIEREPIHVIIKLDCSTSRHRNCNYDEKSTSECRIKIKNLVKTDFNCLPTVELNNVFTSRHRFINLLTERCPKEYYKEWNFYNIFVIFVLDDSKYEIRLLLVDNKVDKKIKINSIPLLLSPTSHSNNNDNKDNENEPVMYDPKIVQWGLIEPNDQGIKGGKIIFTNRKEIFNPETNEVELISERTMNGIFKEYGISNHELSVLDKHPAVVHKNIAEWINYTTDVDDIR